MNAEDAGEATDATEPVEATEQTTGLVDARGLRCPLPVIHLARLVREQPRLRRVTVLATDPAAAHDIPAWCRMRGHRYLGSSPYDDATTDATDATDPADLRDGPAGETGRTAASGTAASGTAASGTAASGGKESGTAASGSDESGAAAGRANAYEVGVVRPTGEAAAP